MYVEGDLPVSVGTGNCSNNNDGFGGWWGIVALVAVAAIFGWGGNGGGIFGGGRGGNGGNEMLGYQLGGLATQADVASGFNNSAVLSSLNDLKLGQSSLQNTLCQGFSGIQQGLTTQGYETRLGLNGLSSQIANCCCDLRAGQADLKYTMATDTCDIKQTINNQTQAILGWLAQEKMASLQAENQSLKFAASQSAQNAFIAANQSAQTAELIRRLGADCPTPAFVVQPPQPVTFPTNCHGVFNGYGYGNNACGCGCGCTGGASVQ